MKVIIAAIAGLITMSLWSGCKPEDRYVDLNTGDRVDLEKDSSSGLMVRTDTKKPVDIYVDTKTKDTIYARTGKVINGHVVKLGEWKYKYDDEYMIKNDDADYKKKVEKDGDIKIKDGDTKIKIDGETGEKKTKRD
jgi:hypothetical protein